MSQNYNEFEENDDYEAERPRDNKIDAAKKILAAELFADDSDAVYYQRQLEARYEATFFHWITAKALNELAQEGVLATSLEQLGPTTNIRFYMHVRNRYWKRRAQAIRKIVLKFSHPNFSHAVGQQGEIMFDAALPRAGFMPIAPFKNVKAFEGKTWTATKHDLDRAFSRDGINYGIEIKNTLPYIDRQELDIKLEMCRYLDLRPLFIMRSAPKSYIYEINRRSGIALIFGKQLYPYGMNDLAKEVREELGMPVECVREVEAGTAQRLLKAHGYLLNRLSRPHGD